MNSTGEIRQDREHYMDRWERMGIAMYVALDCVDGVYATRSKNRSMARAHFYRNPVTRLRNCDKCGVLGTPRKIGYRFMMGFGFLCTGCWNSVRILDNKQAEYAENRRMINKLKRSMKTWQRSQTQAS